MNKVMSAGGIAVKNNKILLIRLESGMYAIPKGHLENDESESQAAIREVEEETGVKVKIKGYLGELTRLAVEDSGETVEKTIKVYKMQKVGVSDNDPDEKKIWTSVDDALGNMHFLEEKEFIQRHVGELR